MTKGRLHITVLPFVLSACSVDLELSVSVNAPPDLAAIEILWHPQPPLPHCTGPDGGITWTVPR